ncbi:MAG: hypothetical protein ACREJ3_06315 [Polyangiaceae bacterium]
MTTRPVIIMTIEGERRDGGLVIITAMAITLAIDPDGTWPTRNSCSDL